jgi:REP element-mobilizing transposase RayT
MSHSYNKLWVHVVFSTKNREALIRQDIETKVHQHIREQLIETGCFVRIINGMADHVHLLFLLNQQKSIAEVIKQIKGNTSYWINGQSLIPEKFSWQTGYGAFSVSESQLEKVFNYIQYQKQHHEKQQFIKEYEELIRLHGLQKKED